MQYLKQAVTELIAGYSGKLPLTHYLKQYFKTHPKLGSRDRRGISDAVYTYYRIARFLPDTDQSTADIWSVIATGLTHCGLEQPLLQRIISASDTKPYTIDITGNLPGLTLSSGMDAYAWKAAMLQQPRVFLRLRQRIPQTLHLLQQQDIAFEQPEAGVLSVPNGAPVDKILPAADYVVQDYSSQHSLDLLLQQATNGPVRVWDTCSGAGGKMLLLKDRYPEAQVLSTDIRPSILHNLRSRARLYGHHSVRTQVVDSSDAAAVQESVSGLYDWVISDVPCSGSGTWARTPEQFFFFQEAQLEQFAALQWSIARNTCRKVRPGGYFLYITCSVFTAENEAIVQQIVATYPDMERVNDQLLNGIALQADSMYVALLRRKG